MDARKERQSQGMDISQLIRNDERNPERGPGVAQRMEGTGDSNRSTKFTNSDAGKTSPNAPNRHQWGRTKKRSMQGQEGGSTPAKKKLRTHNRPPRGPTQAPPHPEQPPIQSMEEVRVEETTTRTWEIPKEEEPGRGT
jgi:hypothetical protein